MMLGNAEDEMDVYSMPADPWLSWERKQWLAI